MGQPSISVIIPVGPSAPLLGDQLRSLASQDAEKPFEVVLCFNRSAVKTPVVSFPAEVDVRTTHASERASAAYARNVGARFAVGTTLLFCDADDVVDARWVPSMQSALSRDVAVGGRIDEEFLNPPEILRWRPPVTTTDLPLMFGARYFLTANFGIRREVFDDLGGFDERLPINEDVAFAWRLQAAGYRLGFADDAVVHYRHRPGLRAMLRQHYAYGRGMTMLLRHYGLPRIEGEAFSLVTPELGAYFRPNGQAPRTSSSGSRLRRTAIGAGRLRELVIPTRLSRTSSQDTP